ncbi:MAG TPA: hypothetical protein VGO09_04530 [Flavisolibacter sp.]|jgi:flagellar biosynthesis protein FliP|nr:hypothetical protein [Flavisolibacter sp.]
MKRNSTSAIGALHPVLFFMVVYGISLFLAIFVCRTVYYSVNNDGSANNSSLQAGVNYSGSNLNATALK